MKKWPCETPFCCEDLLSSFFSLIISENADGLLAITMFIRHLRQKCPMTLLHVVDQWKESPNKLTSVMTNIHMATLIYKYNQKLENGINIDLYFNQLYFIIIWTQKYFYLLVSYKLLLKISFIYWRKHSRICENENFINCRHKHNF